MINGAIMNVDAWMRYKRRLALSHLRDVDKILKEENRRNRKRRARGKWGAFFK